MTLLVILLNIEGGANTKSLAKGVKAGIRNDEKNHSRTIGFSLGELQPGSKGLQFRR